MIPDADTQQEVRVVREVAAPVSRFIDRFEAGDLRE